MDNSELKLTKEEEKALKRYYKFYEDLDTGKRKPISSAQQHFIDCCRGRAQAETVHERAYLKDKLFKIKILESDRREKEAAVIIPEYEEGQPRPGLCNTEDVIKERGNLYGDTQIVHKS